nr:invasion associated locus B family protein [Brucella pituitosa]
MKLYHYSAALLAVLFGTLAAGTANSAPLPNGASTLSETYQDWTVSCQTQKDATRCVMTQTQSDAKSGQRVFAAEINNTNGKSEGVLVLPFGMDLAKGVTLNTGDGTQALTYSTCLPQGCLVPVSLSEKQVSKLKSTTELNVIAAALGQKDPVSFKLSLKGFAQAFERIGTLAN